MFIKMLQYNYTLLHPTTTCAGGEPAFQRQRGEWRRRASNLQLASRPVATRNGLACLPLKCAILTRKFCYRAENIIFAAIFIFALGLASCAQAKMLDCLSHDRAVNAGLDFSINTLKKPVETNTETQFIAVFTNLSTNNVLLTTVGGKIEIAFYFFKKSGKKVDVLAIPFVHSSRGTVTLKPGESRSRVILFRANDGIVPGYYAFEAKIHCGDLSAHGYKSFWLLSNQLRVFLN